MLFLSNKLKANGPIELHVIHSTNKKYLCQLVTVVTIVTVDSIEHYNLPDFTHECDMINTESSLECNDWARSAR